MNCIQEQILYLVQSYPKHFAQKIKRDPSLFDYVNTDKEITVSEMAYNAVYPEEPSVCKHGNNKKFKSFQDGYGFCGIAKKCECARESVSRNVKQSKSVITQQKQQEINQKRIKTNLKKYGVVNTGQTEKARCAHNEVYSNQDRIQEISNQVAQTKALRYGNSSYNNSEQIKKTWHKKKADYFDELYPDKDLSTLRDRDSLQDMFKCNTPEQIARRLNVHVQTVYKYLTDHKLRSKFKSTLEQEMLLFLRSLGVTNIVENSRKILVSGKEIDLYLPDYNIAIEMNGVYWHHDTVSHIDKHYHKAKFKECESQGIHLITVFSDLWESKRDIIQSMIAHKLGMNIQKEHARKLTIHEVCSHQATEFLRKNHIQGSTGASYKYGLFKGEELYAIMTFSKPRVGIGKFRENTAELVRYASKCTVMGGASKLLAHFKKTHPEFTDIVSYSDNEWSLGSMYQKLGFTLHQEHAPSYFYYHRSTGRKHRYNFAKHKLIAQGEDNTKSEYQIMQARGYIRIWDCGKRTWVLSQ